MKCRTASQRAAHPLQGIHNVGRFTRFSSDRIAMPAASGDVLAGNRVRRGASSPTTGASSERRARSPTHRSGRPAPPVARSDATGGSFSDGAPRGAVKTHDSSTTGKRTRARRSRDIGPRRGRRAPRHRRAEVPVADGPHFPSSRYCDRRRAHRCCVSVASRSSKLAPRQQIASKFKKSDKTDESSYRARTCSIFTSGTDP